MCSVDLAAYKMGNTYYGCLTTLDRRHKLPQFYEQPEDFGTRIDLQLRHPDMIYFSPDIRPYIMLHDWAVS